MPLFFEKNAEKSDFFGKTFGLFRASALAFSDAAVIFGRRLLPHCLRYHSPEATVAKCSP